MKKITVLTVILMVCAHEALASFPLKNSDAGTEGKAQGEIKVTASYEHNDSDGQKSATTKPNADLSYGLSDTVDMGIGQSYRIKRKKIGGEVSKVEGIADTELELKWRVYEWRNLSFALKPVVTLPTGDDAKGLGSGRVTAALFLLGTMEAAPWAFHVNAGYEQNENREDERIPLWHFSTAAEFKVNNEVKLAGEVGMDRNSEKYSSSHPAYATVGAVYSLAENIDFRLGLRCGLNSVATDYIVRTGMAFKF